MYVFHIELRLRLLVKSLDNIYKKKNTEFLFQHTEKKRYCDKGA